MGPQLKPSTILNYCNIDNKTIDYFVDTTPRQIKIRFMPGKNIKILSYQI